MAELSLRQGVFGKRKEQYGTLYFLKVELERKAKKTPLALSLFEMLLFKSRFADFFFLSTFDELRVYKAELEHMNSF